MMLHYPRFMALSFELENITLEEFERLRIRFGGPKVSLPNIRKSGAKFSGSASRRTYAFNKDLFYFRLITQISYESAYNLIESHRHEQATVDLVWFPNGSLPIGTAMARTRKDSTYIDYIAQDQQEDRLVVWVRYQSMTGQKEKKTDTFDYSKESGLWVLGRMELQNPNFRRYNFSISGIDLGSTPLYIIPAIRDI